MVFLCPLSVTPSSIINPKMVIYALFLSFRTKSAPIIYAIAPWPFLQYRRILSLKVDLSVPVWPKIAFLVRSEQ